MIRQHFKQIFLSVLTIGLAFQPLSAQDESSDEKKKLAQLTFISPIGSNGFSSSEITNSLSLNILAGVSGGVQGLELGGLHNTTKGDMRGTQFAGMGNLTTGMVHGVQMGGLYNVNTGVSKGMLASGIANVLTGPTKGAQFAGISNVASQESRSFQAAGIANIASQGNCGMQISGITNYNGFEGEGAQLSGIANVNLSSHNFFQLSGIVNFARQTTKGAQIAGIANYTKKLNGFQLGLINIADTVERGVPLGLISVVKQGYYAFELEANDAFWINATYKMGVPKLYNIFTVGFNHQNGEDMWAVGLGLGTLLPLGEKWGLNIDLTSSHVNENEWWTNELNLLNRLKLNAWVDLGPLQLYGGPSLNVFVSQLLDSESHPSGNLLDPSFSFYKTTKNQTTSIIYPGFNFGIRF